MRFAIDGAKLCALRHKRGLSRAYVARVVRRAPTTVQKWEAGEVTRTSGETLEALARVLAVTPYDLSPDYIPPRDPSVGRVYFDQELANRTRVLKRLTYRELAMRAGLPLTTVHRLLNKDKPSADAEHVYVLACGLGLKPGDLSEPLAATPGLDDREILEGVRMPLTNK
jgi:transcriptional regulator with XRE-family HTH domain